jgi:hypothetical protein
VHDARACPDDDGDDIGAHYDDDNDCARRDDGNAGNGHIHDNAHGYDACMAAEDDVYQASVNDPLQTSNKITNMLKRLFFSYSIRIIYCKGY